MNGGPTVVITADWPETIINEGDDTPEVVIEAPPQPEISLSEVGIRGRDGAGATIYEHTQDVASDTWIVNHNFGRKPTSIQLLTMGGVEFGADIVHVSDNQLRVLLAEPFTGLVRVM